MGPLIGSGGYGRVYRAMFNGQPVAIKVSPPNNPTTSPTSEPVRCLHTCRPACAGPLSAAATPAGTLFGETG